MSKDLIQLKNISKSFASGLVSMRALDHIDLIIKKGEFVALQGPSGCGKSTLLNVLGLIEMVDDGEVLFDDQSTSSLSDSGRTKIRRSSIGFIFQNFNLLPMISTVENVEYPMLLLGKESKKEIRENAMKALEMLGIGGFASRMPAQLSGGQRQRVAIARAIVKNPSLILADEPTANLDSHNAEQTISILEKLNRDLGTAVILATHDNHFAKHARRHLQLVDGRIISDSINGGLS